MVASRKKHLLVMVVITMAFCCLYFGACFADGGGGSFTDPFIVDLNRYSQVFNYNFGYSRGNVYMEMKAPKDGTFYVTLHTKEASMYLSQLDRDGKEISKSEEITYNVRYTEEIAVEKNEVFRTMISCG